MDISIRRATIEDLPSMQQANLSCLPENYQMKFYFYHLTCWPNLSHVAVDRKGNVVAYVLAKMEEEAAEAHGHLTSVATLRPYRKLGLASKIMNQVEKTMSEAYDAQYVSLHVRRSNRPALKLYTDLGFKVEDIEKGYYADGEDAFSMKKEIAIHVPFGCFAKAAKKDILLSARGLKNSAIWIFLKKDEKVTLFHTDKWTSNDELFQEKDSDDVEVFLFTTEDQKKRWEAAITKLNPKIEISKDEHTEVLVRRSDYPFSRTFNPSVDNSTWLGAMDLQRRLETFRHLPGKEEVHQEEKKPTPAKGKKGQHQQPAAQQPAAEEKKDEKEAAASSEETEKRYGSFLVYDDKKLLTLSSEYVKTFTDLTNHFDKKEGFYNTKALPSEESEKFKTTKSGYGKGTFEVIKKNWIEKEEKKI